MSNNFQELGGSVAKRALKIYWLCDISGSMGGDKIAALNRAVREVIPVLKKEADENPEVKVFVRTLKFSTKADWHHDEIEIEKFTWHDLTVSGATSTGAALTLMSQELTLDKFGNRNLPPVLILMSDGGATDNYDNGLNNLLSSTWGPKSVRFAIAIGQDADIEELTKFCSNPKEIPPLIANNAADLVQFIRWASTVAAMSVVKSAINTGSDSNVHVPPPPPKVTIAGGSSQSGADVW